MEVLRAGSVETVCSASGVLYGTSVAATDDGSGSSIEKIALTSRLRKAGEEDKARTSAVPCAVVRKSPSARVLSHLLQYNTQRPQPAFPTPAASPAAAVLLAFAAAPLHAGSVSAEGSGAPVPAPAAAAAAPGSAFLACDTLPCPPAAAAASRGASPAAAAPDAVFAAAAAARFAAAVAVLASEGGRIEPARGRPFTIEEETQQQLLDEEDEGAAAGAAGAAAAAATTATRDAVAAVEAGRTAAAAPAALAAAVPSAEAEGHRTSCGGQPLRYSEEAAHPEQEETVTAVAAAAAAPVLSKATSAGGGGGAEGGGTRLPTAAAAGDTETAAEDASISTEFVESCAVPWKPTCLTEISFDYSVPSTREAGASSTPSLYESQRSTTSDPAEGPSADNTAAAALEVAAVNPVPSSLCRRWSSGSLQPAQGCAAAARSMGGRPPGLHRRTASITSDSDCSTAAAATEGMPSNVSRWRLGRATPLRHDMQRLDHQELFLQQQQHVPGLHLPPQQSMEKQTPEMSLQQQLEAVLKQQQEEKHDVLQREQQQQQTVQLQREEQPKHRLEIRADQSEVRKEQQAAGVQVLLQTENAKEALLEQRRQQQKAAKMPQQPQQQPKEPHKHPQQQSQGEDLVQPEDFVPAQQFFSLVARQLQQQQEQQQQHGDMQHPGVSLGQHTSGEALAAEQGRPQQLSGTQTDTFLRREQHPLHVLHQQENRATTHEPHGELRSCENVPSEATAASPTATQAAAVCAAGPEFPPTAGRSSPCLPGTGTACPDFLPGMKGPLPAAVVEDGILAAAAAAAAAAAESAGKAGAASCRQRYTQPRTRRKKRRNGKGGRFVQTSSSGYPGVSWNRRMGAWLAFFYDTQSRRSRTFHPRYFNGDIEATRVAAIEFKKSVDRLFASASKPMAEASGDAVEAQDRRDELLEEQPQEEEGEHPQERGEDQEEDEEEEDEETPRPQHVLDDLPKQPEQRTSPAWAASVLPAQTLFPRDGRAEEEAQRSENRSSSGLYAKSRRVPGEAHVAREAATLGRKRGRRNDAGETQAASSPGCAGSPCSPLLSSAALLPAATTANGVVAAETGAPEEGCTDGAALLGHLVGAAVDSAAAVAAPVHGGVGEAADPAASAGRETSAAAEAHVNASPGNANSTDPATSSALGVNLSVLAAMGSHERLQKVLSLGTDVPLCTPTRPLAWGRHSTLSAENLNALCRISRPNLHLTAESTGGPPCPATAGNASGGGAAGDEAAREGGGKAAAHTTLHEPLRRKASVDDERGDEHNLSVLSLLPQLQLNEGGTAAGVAGSDLRLDDAVLVREGEQELHRVLQQSYGVNPFPFLWREQLSFPHSKEAYCGAPVQSSRLHEEISSTTGHSSSACSSSICSSNISGGRESFSDSGSRSGNIDSRVSHHCSGGRPSITDSTISRGIVQSGGRCSGEGATGYCSTAVFSTSKSDGGISQQMAPSTTSCLEKLCLLLGGTADKGLAEGEGAKQGLATADMTSFSWPFCTQMQAVDGNNDSTSLSALFKQAVDAIQINWLNSGVGGGLVGDGLSCQGRGSSHNGVGPQEQVL